MVEIPGRLKELGYGRARGALFCVDYPRLMDRHYRKVMEELADVGTIKNTKTEGTVFRAHDPELGSVYLRNAKDPDKYRGIEYDFVLMDELTEFTRDEFDSIMYQLRSPRDLPFLAMGAASNPDGIGHGWCKKLWIDRDFSNEKGYSDSDFFFIPAKAYDNPTFTDTIKARLTGFADDMLVKSRWDGSWDIASGTRFGTFSREAHVITEEQFYNMMGMRWMQAARDPEFTVYGCLDYGTDIYAASAFYLFIVSNHGRIFVCMELYMSGKTLEQQAKIISAAIKDIPVKRIYADPALWGSGKESDGICRAVKFRKHGISLVRGINDRVEGWASIDACLHYMKDEEGRVLHPPRMVILSHCKQLISDIAEAPRDEVNHEDVRRRFKRDHSLDAIRYGIHSRFSYIQKQEGRRKSGLETFREQLGYVKISGGDSLKFDSTPALGDILEL